MDIRQRLQEACDDGELISIVYHGGSHAGLARRIVVTNVTADAVWAREADGRQSKQFKISKIQLAPADAVVHNLDDSQAPQPSTLDEAIAPHMAILMDSPWVVVSEPNAIKLYGTFKNGKRRKRPALALTYQEPWTKLDATDVATGEKHPVERELTGAERPWSVASPKGTWNFKKLSSAIQRLLDEFSREMVGG